MYAATIKIFILGGMVLLLSAPQSVRAQEEIPDLFETSFGLETASNYEAAYDNVAKILRRDGNHYVAVLRAGWLSYKLGYHERAIKHYRKAIALSPDSLEAKLGVILPQIAQADWRAAEVSARAALALSPKDYYGNSRLAWVLYSQGKYTEALRFYQAVLKRYPSDLDMQLGVGWTLLKMGRRTDARAMFKRVLQVQRNNTSARQGMLSIGS